MSKRAMPTSPPRKGRAGLEFPNRQPVVGWPAYPANPFFIIILCLKLKIIKNNKFLYYINKFINLKKFYKQKF